MTNLSNAVSSVNTEDIEKAAVTIQKIRPAYSPMIEFYSQVFSAQARTLSGLNPEPIVIDSEMLALKRENEMPLISPVQFSIDMPAARSLMETIAGLAIAHTPKLARAGEIITRALAAPETPSLDLDRLFTALLDSQSIDQMAQDLDLTTEELAFFGYTAMTPSIQANAAQLAAYLDPEQQHNKGYCPVCGSHPDLGFLDKNGKKHVTCALCAHTWQVKRMGCLFCDADDKDAQHYFFSNDEKEYRVYYCNHCKHYLKIVDKRELARCFVPRLEQIATLHLDVKAKEQGFTSFGQGPSAE